MTTAPLRDIVALRKTCIRLRRLMPMDRDVQAVCYALQSVLDLQPTSKKAQKLGAKLDQDARREYKRQWIARYRAQQRKQKQEGINGTP